MDCSSLPQHHTGPRTNVHTWTDAVCPKLLRLSASKPEWRWPGWRWEIKCRKMIKMWRWARGRESNSLSSWHKFMCKVGGRRMVRGSLGRMQPKTVSFMPPFNVCAVKADARSDETHLCSREQEHSATYTAYSEYLPYLPQTLVKEAARSWTPSKPKITKTGPFTTISCCCNWLVFWLQHSLPLGLRSFPFKVEHLQIAEKDDFSIRAIKVKNNFP